jgi:short-subunit dehydrogenase
MVRNLDGMTVAITGASAGIGRELAVALAGRGARLALAARRLDRLEELDRQLGGGHLTMRADVAVPEDCARFVAAAQAYFGRLDTLVCNAGRGLFRAIADTSAEEWRDILATNLIGTIDCVRAALPQMRKQELRDGWRGQVVIVSSCVARRAVPDIGAYCVTKAAQLSLGEALRVELRDERIAVTSVHPVGTDTEFGEAARQVSKVAVKPRLAIEPRQSAEKVAAAIVRAIVRPRAEVWPHRVSRWAFSLATLMPGTADRIMVSQRRIAD